MAYKDRLADYVEVPERMVWFFEHYPDGSLQSEVIEHTEHLIMVRALAYRTPQDERPGMGLASEVVPGKTTFTADSEAMNAETSAWGRALAAIGAPTRGHVASAQEVRARSKDSAPAGTGEKTQGTVQDAGRPAADEPGVVQVGLGEGTTVTPGSTIPESEVTVGDTVLTSPPPSDDREHATPEQWNRLLELVGNEAKAVPIAAKTLGRSMTRTALAMLTQAEMTKVIEGAMA